MQSEFHRDISNIEKKLFGVTARQFKAVFILVIVSIIVVVEAFFLPDKLVYLMAFLTGVLLAPYPVLLLTNQWKKVKRKMFLYFSYEQSIYLTGQIRRYEADEFTQAKGIKETDNI